jgi:subtilisin family serine protease
MNQTTPPAAGESAPQSRPVDWLNLFVLGMTSLWIIAVVFLTQMMAWLTDQILLILGTPWPGWSWFAVYLSQTVLILPVVGMAALFLRRPRYRAVYQSWALAAGYSLWLSPARLIPPTGNQLAGGLQIWLSAGFLLFLGLLIWLYRGTGGWRPARSEIGLALLLAAVMALPWLAWGALGSPLDALLNLVGGLLLGLMASLILSYVTLPSLRAASNGRGWDIVLGGWTASLMLLLLASGLGLNGLQLLLMLSLPAGGVAAAILGYPARTTTDSRPRWLAPALFTGLSAAWPAMFIDPDEMALILGVGGRDILSWAAYAALASLIIGWGLSIFLFVIQRHLARPRTRPIITGGAAAAWLLAAAVYFLGGQPGFYGEQLFVILKDQADLSTAAGISNYDARRQYVYTSLVDHADSTQAHIRDSLDRLGIDYQPYYLTNGLAVDGGPLLRWWLSRQPEVDRVLDNPILRPLPQPAAGAQGTASLPAGQLWNLTVIAADQVWDTYGVTGEGIVIGHSDSGVQGDHPELADRYRGQNTSHDYNWLDPWNATTEPTDIGGHGTHTLGTILGQNTGVAPGAQWIGCVNLARNLANPALYLDCLQFMLAPYPLNGDPLRDGDPTRSAHILNNSWGCPEMEGCDPEALLDAAQALRAAGIFVVASAGNEGPWCETINNPLALYDEAFSVGAVDRSGYLAGFSSRGPVTADGSGRIKPDIVAPGVDILSAFPNNSYAYLQGTSMAGPHVAGVVALMWSANPDLIGDIDLTEVILRRTATAYAYSHGDCGGTASLPNNHAGFGLVDAYAAVTEALVAAGD